MTIWRGNGIQGMVYKYCFFMWICMFAFVCLNGCGASVKGDEQTISAKQEDVREEMETVEKEPADVSASYKNEEELLETVSDQQRSEQEKPPVPETLHFIDAWGEWHDAVINPEVKMHDYDWQYLKNDGQEISYEGDDRYTIRRGIDVSHHQGTINWKKVKEDGYDFAIMRVAFRGYGASGVLKQDKEFANYIGQAQEAGLDVGVYIFSQAVNEEEALEEADFVLNTLKGYDIELPVVYDPELIRDDKARTDNVTGEQFTANTLAFCKKIQEAGYQPMIYSNMIWESELFDMEQLDEYPIWYADYELIPQTPYDFTFWQYSESGRVDSISGAVDLDVQFIRK